MATEALMMGMDDTDQPMAPIDKLRSYLDMDNIAEELEESALGTIGARVVKEYEIDLASRSEWDERMDEAMKIALQVKEEKTFPWPGAANVKYPLMTTAAIQFAARAYPAIVSGKDVVKGKINGEDPDGGKQAKADRVGRHMSWQLLEDMPEWEPETDRLLHILPIIGVVFRKTYFSPAEGRNVSELVIGKDFVVNYKAKSLETAPRQTHRFDLYPYEIEERVRAGLWLDQDIKRQHGSEDEDEPIEFLEQHRRWDLDDDGYAEPCIITVHKDSGKVVRIVPGFIEEGLVWDGQGNVVRVERESYFTKYGFIPNPDSAIYDLGLGYLLHPINETVNTVLNQLLDAGTLANTDSGFIGKGLRMKGGPIRSKLGQYVPVDVSGQTIRDNIVPMQHKEPSLVLFQLLGLLIEAGREIASVKDVLTGDAQSANASPTTTLALIEQGLKTFTAIFKRVHRSLKSELKKLYKLNSIYLNPEEYFTFHDSPEAVSRQDYEDRTLDVTPVSDPSVVTDMQRMGRGQALLQFNGDPLVNQMEIRRRYLMAIGVENIDQVLQEPEQGPGPQEIMLQHQMDMEKMEMALKADNASIEKLKMVTEAIRNLADAESKEQGTQLAFYKQQLEEITRSTDERGNNAGRLQPMAAPPGNQGGI